MLLLALFDASDPYIKETPFTTFAATYTLTSFIGGYATASFYSQLEGTYWVSKLGLECLCYSFVCNFMHALSSMFVYCFRKKT